MKRIMRLISFLIIVCVISSLFSINSLAASTPTISVGKVICKAGEEAEVVIELSDNPGIVSLSLQVLFDSEILTLTEVRDEGTLGTQFHKPEYVSPYTLVWANDTATENFTVNGTVATLVFTVKENIQKGTEIPITLNYNYENYDIYDKDLNKVHFNIVNGSVTVKENEVPIDELLYEITDNGISIIGYTGTATELTIAPIYTVNGVEYPVTVISESAFEGNKSIKSIIIPESVTSVGDYAFYDCNSLVEVTMLNPDTVIGEKALGYYYVSRKEEGVVEGFTIIGYDGSTANEYADADSNITFVSLESLKLKGDLSRNGIIDAPDLVLFRKHLLGSEVLSGDLLEIAEINQDGVVDIRDLVGLKKVLINFV